MTINLIIISAMIRKGGHDNMYAVHCSGFCIKFRVESDVDLYMSLQCVAHHGHPFIRWAQQGEARVCLALAYKLVFCFLVLLYSFLKLHIFLYFFTFSKYKYTLTHSQ